MVISVSARYLLCAVAGRRSEVNETNSPGATCEVVTLLLEEDEMTTLVEAEEAVMFEETDEVTAALEFPLVPQEQRSKMDKLERISECFFMNIISEATITPSFF
jgi:hypothetical protein